MDAAKPKLLDAVRDKIRLKHYSIRTETAYADWIRRFIRFHDRQHPANLEAAHVTAFLTHLAVAGKVAASTQNQARSALLFLYKEVLEIELPWLEGVISAKTPRRLPVVLTEEKVKRFLLRTDGTPGLMLKLIYGSGMRIMELRTKRPSSGQCTKPCVMPASQSPPPRTRCAIRSPPTCSRPATISAPSRNCRATRMSAPP
jgi:integrase